MVLKHSMCPAHSFKPSEVVWGKQQKQQRTMKGEGRTQQSRGSGEDSAFTAKLHFLKTKCTCSQPTDFLGERPCLKLNSAYRGGQLYSLFLFFFLTERWKPILFLLQNWRTSGFLNTSVSQLKDVSFQFPFQGLWFSFARVTANSACFPRCLQCCLLMQHKSYSNTCNWFHM